MEVNRKFDSCNSLIEKRIIMKETGQRADIEYYNHLKYKAYMNGLIKLRINHYQEELTATVDATIRDMKSLLSHKAEDPGLREYGRKLNSKMFLGIEQEEDCKTFNIAYEAYKVIRLQRDNELKKMQLKERQNTRTRQFFDEIKYRQDEEERRRHEEHLRRLQYYDDRHREEERIKLIEEKRRRQEEALRKQKDFEERMKKISEDLKNQEDEERIKMMEQRFRDEQDREENTDETVDTDEMFIESDINAKMHQEFEDKAQELYRQNENKNPFIDFDFNGANAVYGAFGGGDNYNIDKWERIKNMKDNDGRSITRPEVIAQGLGAGDIGQGAIGDCWFLSALSVVAYNRPDLIKALISKHCRKYREDGLYVVRFFKMGYHQVVHVDDRFPVNRRGQSVFCKIQTEEGITEFWPILLEKAYAKLHGSYESLSAGRPEQGLVDLTNGVSEIISFDSEEFKQMKNNGSFWEKLKC